MSAETENDKLAQMERTDFSKLSDTVILRQRTDAVR